MSEFSLRLFCADKTLALSLLLLWLFVMQL